MFCLMEINRETFIQIKSYAIQIRDKKNIFKIDQEAQNDQILIHCYNVHKKDNEECIEWVQKYSKGYRLFLNTAKMIIFCLGLLEKPLEDVTFEDYKRIAEKWNENKDNYMEYIF